jgi:hypothetical protein
VEGVGAAAGAGAAVAAAAGAVAAGLEGGWAGRNGLAVAWELAAPLSCKAGCMTVKASAVVFREA